MNLQIKIRQRIRIIRLFSLCLFLVVLFLFCTSSKQKPDPYSILEFTGSDAVLNYSKSQYMLSYKSDGVNPTGLLASDGDLIFYGDEAYIYRKSFGNKFRFNISKEGGYINGKITTLNLKSSNDVISWFKLMETADLSMLDLIKIDSPVPEDYYPYLADLAKTKPGLGLVYDGDLNDISRMIKLFNPKYLLGETVYGRDFDLLSKLTNLEVLVVALHDSVNTAPLPALPGLKQLFLTEVNDRVVLNELFLSENKSLKKLIIMESKRIDFSILKPLNNLEELVISNFDTIENFDLLQTQKNLELLSILSKKSKYNHLTDGLKGIRWMTFSSNVSQDDFNSFINNHPDLEVAEILENDTISSLSSLLQLKNLYGLTISDTLTDLASVKSLKNLKFLSLPSYVLKDKLIKEDLQKLLPGTMIVANEGFCLGSGWLLLIIPIVLFFSLVAGKKFSKAKRAC